MLDAQRLWADLLSSSGLCFNLFGDLAADPALAHRAVHTWWTDAPEQGARDPVRALARALDPAYLANLSAFEVALVLDLGGGAHGMLGVETKYHERVKREVPKPSRLSRYVEVTERSGVFAAGAVEAVNGTDLLQLWLDRLLVLSMLQHPDGTWRWGRLVVVHPAGNSDVAEACERYRELLVDPSTFASVTVEDLLDAGALPAATAEALRVRYIPGWQVAGASPSRAKGNCRSACGTGRRGVQVVGSASGQVPADGLTARPGGNGGRHPQARDGVPTPAADVCSATAAHRYA